MITAAESFDRMWADLEPIGRDPRTQGYRRFAYTRAEAQCREWFTGEARRRSLDVHTDRNGNLWSWWGDPDRGGPGVVTGSHLDSVPDGGAYDGPLGIVAGFAALDGIRARHGSTAPGRPLAVVAFADEEGARFGVACAGSRLLTGQLEADRARGLRDADGTTMAEAMRATGHDPTDLGPDDETLRRIATFVELHVEQGRGLVDLNRPVGVSSGIWPHGRWRLDFQGRANHAGTTRLEDRDDPMLAYARAVLATREAAERHASLATIGRVRVEPNGTNAIPSRVTAWLDARGPREPGVRAIVDDLAKTGAHPVEESWTPATTFDAALSRRVAALIGDAPELQTGAGHDAGILTTAGIPTTMLFVRNPTGVSHAPDEHADRADCLAGVEALTAVLTDLTA